MTEQRKPSKPQPRRVPSDDCEVVIGGNTFYPHVGESLWILGSEKIGQMKNRWAFLYLSSEMDEASADPQAAGESDEDYKRRVDRSHRDRLELVERQYDELIAWFADRLVRWDWTDDRGRPMLDLDGTTAPFLKLSMDEIYYIKTVLSGEGPAETLNAGTDSANTPSATESPAKKA